MKLVFVFTCLLAVTGCVSTEPVTLGAEYSPPPEDLRSESLSPSCIYTIRDLTDLRKNKESLGTLGWTTVLNSDVLLWVKSAFIHRGHKAFVKDEARNNIVDIGLKKAYIRSSSTSKASVVVLVKYDEDLKDIKYFRGSSSSMNWNSSSSEINNSLNTALKNAILKMEASLGSICTEPN